MAIILGIDPGSRITGYGIIKAHGTSTEYVASGCIVPDASDFATRLREIFNGVSEIIKAYEPTEVAIEQVFVKCNVGTALKLGQARGAIIVATALKGLPISEYSARSVKQAISGYGAAAKNQIQHMIQCLLHLPGKPAVDAADALAVALCHIQTQHSLQRGLR